uniref:F-box/kelch-repeat protein n=1 Tax=Ananas comosus var. bracteatus TaxID=296719 RepID=A0A6V7PML5_ANACO|nr:unnamed protein product [Ananas comosus var. bracteatus]
MLIDTATTWKRMGDKVTRAFSHFPPPSLDPRGDPFAAISGDLGSWISGGGCGDRRSGGGDRAYELRSLRSLIGASMKELQLKSQSMAGAPASVLLQIVRSSGQDQSSLHYILAILLVAQNGYLLKEIREFTFRNKLYSDQTELKKKKPLFRSQLGSDHNDQSSNDCFLPGLHDDIALDCLALTSRSDYPSLAFLNKRFNNLIRSGYLYQLRRKLGIIEHWVYLACTLMPWEAFDPFRLRWMRLPRMPCDDCFSCADKESLAVSAHELTSLPFGSGSSGEIAIVAGGSDMNGRVLKCVDLYNSELGVWESLPDMNIPRRSCSGFFMDGKFYVIGGLSSHTDSLTCGEVYDLKTRTWRIIKDMYPGGIRASQSPPLIAVVNNQLYAADQSMNVVKKYDKVNNSWSVVRRLPVRADSSNGWGSLSRHVATSYWLLAGIEGPAVRSSYCILGVLVMSRVAMEIGMFFLSGNGPVLSYTIVQ